MPHPSTRTRSLVTSALLAALLAVSAFMTVPLGPVPFTLQTLVVVLVALVSTPAQAATTLGLYLALGAVGAPVFSGGHAGVAVLAGPTGGYLAGFAAGAVAGAAVRRWIVLPSLPRDLLVATLTLAIVYALGATWLAVSTGATPAEAVAGGVVPFLVPEVAKVAGAIVVAAALRRAGFADTPPGTDAV